MTHDQNFKNLILDYPRQALAFFAAAEAHDLPESVRITPLRQEQLQERLGERFRELDTPLLVEWPDGRREALLFLVEEESDPHRFSIYRLVRYCADLAELCQTDRVVPVVVFLRGSPNRRSLTLGGERHTYLSFTYIACELAQLAYHAYRDSDNLVARLNLPNMRYAPDDRVAVYADAVRGLVTLEPDPERQLKYMDFIDIYAGLDDNEQQRYIQEYPNEAATMSHFAERFTAIGEQRGEQRGEKRGEQRGLQRGEATMLLRLMRHKFGDLPEAACRRVETADPDTLLTWSERILTADSIDEVLH